MTLHSIELIREVRILFAVFVQPPGPLLMQFRAPFPDSFAEVFTNSSRYQELGIFGPAIELLGQLDLVFTQRFAVSCTGVLFVRRAVANMTIDNDQSRTIFGLLKIAIGIAEHLQIVGIGHVGYVPAVAPEAQSHVLAERPLRGTIQSDVIVVVNPTQVGKLQMSSQGCRFAGHAFHHVAIAAHGIHVVVEKFEAGTIVIRRQPHAGHCHSDAIADALT